MVTMTFFVVNRMLQDGCYGILGGCKSDAKWLVCHSRWLLGCR